MNTAVAVAALLVGGAVKLALITGATIVGRNIIPQLRMAAPQKDTAPRAAKAEPADSEQQIRVAS